MEELANSLLVPQNGELVPLSSLDEKEAMATAAVLSPYSSQGQNILPSRYSIDNPFSPPPSRQSASVSETLPLGPSTVSGLVNLQDIADFENENPYQPNSVALPRKPTCENTIKFQQLCDKHKIRPEFDYEEPWLANYRAKVVFGTESAATTEVFPSKKQAKEAVSKLAIERLLLVASKQATGTKRKTDRSPSPIDKSQNWIGMLMQHADQTKNFSPSFEEYRTETTPYEFSCKLRLKGGPLELFSAGWFPSKQDAKTAVAHKAVEWLRSQGALQTTKRQKPDSAAHTGITQILSEAAMFDAEPGSSPTLPQRVHNLVAALGYQQPQFKTHRPVTPAGALASTFCDVAAYFNPKDVEREPRLAGSVGAVEGLRGKTNAKEACCVKVLELLEDIKQTRMA